MKKSIDNKHSVVVKCLHNHKTKINKGSIMIIETTVYLKLCGGTEETIYLPSFDCYFEKSYKEAFPRKDGARIDALEAIMKLARGKPDLLFTNIERIEVVYECEFGDKSYVVKL